MTTLTRMAMVVVLGIALYGTLLAASIAATAVAEGPASVWRMLGVLSFTNKGALLLAGAGWGVLAAAVAARLRDARGGGEHG